MKRIPLVEVTWNDAHALAATSDLTIDDMTAAKVDPYVMRTVGWLTKRTRKVVVVANECSFDRESEQHSYRGITSIPVGMVVRIRHLRR